MSAFVEGLLCGHLRGDWGKDPSFVEERPHRRDFYPRSRCSLVVGTTSAVGSTKLERVAEMKGSSQENLG